MKLTGGRTDLWGWARRVAADGKEADAQRLAALVKASAKTKAHEVVWDAMWACIEQPERTKTDVGRALDEAAILGRAVQEATGDRSYLVRVTEYERAADRAGSRRRWIEQRLAEARRAWEQDHNADAARARLSSARSAAKRLTDGASLVAAADALESALPPPAPVAPGGR